jgi:SAM-dependent methyltransferase
MIFNVSDDAYDRFMGRYSVRLAPLFADFAGVTPGQRVLDVGAGTGALAAELVQRLGAEKVAAAEPSAGFVEALRARLPGVEVQEAPAEQLPWPDETFDAALAQLVVSFLADGPAAARELKRVVRPGGTVAVTMWEDGGLELSPPIRAARRAVVPGSEDPPPMKYRSEEELRGLLADAGLEDITTALLEVEREYTGFDEYWEAALGAVGPETGWLRDLADESRPIAREAAKQELGSPSGAFTLRGRAWAARGQSADR